MKVVYSEQARNDLHKIYEYIALTLDAPQSAADITNRIMRTAKSLESMPERNPLYKENPWKNKGVRFTVVGKYMLFYIVKQHIDTVAVARIMYGGRDIARQLESTEWEI